MNLKSILVCLLIAPAFCSHAQQTQKMNLDNLLEYALVNNADIKEAKFNQRKSELSVKETKANGLPQIKASVEYKDYLELATMILPGALAGTDQDIIAKFGKKHNLDAGAQISQLLFSLEYINGVRTAQRAAEIRKLEVDKAEVELYELISTEYLNLLAIYKNLEIIQSNIESLELTQNNLSAMVKRGLALQTDLDRVKINHSNLEANKETIFSGMRIQTNNIKYIIGMEPETNLVVDTTGFMHLFSDELYLEKYADNQFVPEKLVEIQMLDKHIDLSEYQIKAAKSSPTPTLAFFGSYTYQAQREKLNFLDFDQSWFKVNVIGLKATIPIFSGFANRSKIQSAMIDRELTINQREHAAEGLNIQYQNSLMNYKSNIKNCQIQGKNVALAQRVEQQENLKLQQGMSTLTDYLIAVADYRNAQINYVQNLIDTKKSEIQLLKQQGLLRSNLDLYSRKH